MSNTSPLAVTQPSVLTNVVFFCLKFEQLNSIFIVKSIAFIVRFYGFLLYMHI